MHAQWIRLVNKFYYAIKHKSGQSNRVADSLSHREVLLVIVNTEIMVLDSTKDLYTEYEDFGDIWVKCNNHEVFTDFLIQDGFLSRGTQPMCSSIFHM